MTTNSQKTKVSSNFPYLYAILESPTAKKSFFLFWRILKFVDTRNLNVSLPFFERMLYAVRCLKSNEDMILAFAGQFKQLSHEPEKFR